MPSYCVVTYKQSEDVEYCLTPPDYPFYTCNFLLTVLPLQFTFLFTLLLINNAQYDVTQSTRFYEEVCKSVPSGRAVLHMVRGCSEVGRGGELHSKGTAFAHTRCSIDLQ
jgi:hypothetical protein